MKLMAMAVRFTRVAKKPVLTKGTRKWEYGVLVANSEGDENGILIDANRLVVPNEEIHQIFDSPIAGCFTIISE